MKVNTKQALCNTSGVPLPVSQAGWVHLILNQFAKAHTCHNVGWHGCHASVARSDTSKRSRCTNWNTAMTPGRMLYRQEAQLPQRGSASAMHVFLGSLTDHSLHWTPQPPQISAHTLYFRKLESLAYIFVAAGIGLSSFKFVQWAPKDASFLPQSGFWPFKDVQGHPRSMILVPIESAYATSY